MRNFLAFNLKLLSFLFETQLQLRYSYDLSEKETIGNTLGEILH